MASYWWLSILRPTSHIITMVKSLLFSFLSLSEIWKCLSHAQSHVLGSSSSFYSWLCAFTHELIWLTFVYLCAVRQWSLFICFPCLVIDVNFLCQTVHFPFHGPQQCWHTCLLNFYLGLLALFCNLGTWETELGRLLQVGGQPGISAHSVQWILSQSGIWRKTLS